jgi:hypothetical protein
MVREVGPYLIVAAKNLCRTCALQGVVAILGLSMSGVFTSHARAGTRHLLKPLNQFELPRLGNTSCCSQGETRSNDPYETNHNLETP